MQKPPHWCPWISTAKSDIDSFCGLVADSAITFPQSTFEGKTRLKKNLTEGRQTSFHFFSEPLSLQKRAELLFCIPGVVDNFLHRCMPRVGICTIYINVLCHLRLVHESHCISEGISQ